MIKLNNCKFCGSEPFAEWTEDNDYKIECSQPNLCKSWPRIYMQIKKYAEESWNLMNNTEFKGKLYTKAEHKKVLSEKEIIWEEFDEKEKSFNNI